MKIIEGGVCAAKGYTAAGVHCGIRKNSDKKDLALIVSETRANAAAVYTTNLVKGAPLIVTKANIADGKAQAIVCNSGNANTCNANGIEISEAMCANAAKELDISPKDVIVASTGVIGQPLDIRPIADSMRILKKELSEKGAGCAAEAIMTTDTVKKQVAVEFNLGGRLCRMGGMAKGSGMIHPNMATMLVFITTDAAVSSEMLNEALKGDIPETFNMTSVDGDTSTNDMVVLMANSLAGNEEIREKNEDFAEFMKALNTVNVRLCRMIAADGEGATKLIECHVKKAPDKSAAKAAAKSVVCSSLVKAAMFGADANWGRILCALGYCKAQIDVKKIDVSFKSAAGRIEVCRNGSGVDFSEEEAKKILLEDEIDILVSLNSGEYSSCAWGCDLTYDYVKINGDYRT